MTTPRFLAYEKTVPIVLHGVEYCRPRTEVVFP